MGGNALLAVASAVVATAVIEAALQIADYPAHAVYGWSYASLDPDQHDHNELGARGRPLAEGGVAPPAADVIVLLGDSQVECDICRPEEMPERRLEHHLAAASGRPYRVVSLAAGGWGQDQQLLALERFFAGHRAALVVLWFTPHNDIWNNSFPTHWPWNGAPKPTFRLEHGAAVGPVGAAGEPVGSVKAYDLLRIVARTAYERVPASWSNSALVQYAKYAIPGADDIWSLRHLPPPRGRLGIDGCSGAAGLPRINAAGVAIWGREPIWEEKSHLDLYSAQDTPRLSYGLELTSRLLDRIGEVAARNGADLVVLTAAELSPQQFYTRRLFATGERVLAELDGWCLELSRAAFVARVRSLLAGREHVELDLADLGEISRSERDSHLSVAANDEAMRRLAGRLLARQAAVPVTAGRAARPR